MHILQLISWLQSHYSEWTVFSLTHSRQVSIYKPWTFLARSVIHASGRAILWVIWKEKEVFSSFSKVLRWDWSIGVKLSVSREFTETCETSLCFPKGMNQEKNIDDSVIDQVIIWSCSPNVDALIGVPRRKNDVLYNVNCKWKIKFKI